MYNLRNRTEDLGEALPSRGYFTDGVNLYRFIAWLNRAGSASFAAVEDCRSLDVVVVSAAQLSAARVRRVPSSPA